MISNLELALMGLLVGTLIGMTGVGGGVVMVPILVMVMRVPPSIAIGTDLLYASLTKWAGALQHWQMQTVNFEIASFLLVGSLPSALVGTFLVKIIKEWGGGSAENILNRILAGTLILVAAMMLTRIFVHRTNDRHPNVAAPSSRQRRRIWTVLLGAATGLVVGLTSIGAGSLVMVFLVILYSAPAKQLVGTDLFHAAILATVAALGHLFVGNADLRLAAWLSVGSIPGVILGSRLSAWMPDNALRLLLALALFFSGVRLTGAI